MIGIAGETKFDTKEEIYMSRNRMIYGVYEDDELECCVFVGTAPEIAKEFRVHKDKIYDFASQDRLFKWKYKIKRIGYENELEFETE